VEGKSTGVLLPASQLKIDKKTGELVIENYQNPWKLMNIQDRSNKQEVHWRFWIREAASFIASSSDSCSKLPGNDAIHGL